MAISPEYTGILVLNIGFYCVCVCVCVCIREGDGTPLQYSCLENPMDGGAR